MSKVVKVAWYDSKGNLIQAFESLTEMYKETGYVQSVIYKSNLFGHYLDEQRTFAKYFEDKPPKYIEPPKHSKRGFSKKTYAQENRKRAEPRELYKGSSDERNENAKVIRSSLISISKVLDEIGHEKTNQIRSMLNKIQNESIMYGIKSERMGVGEELENKIYKLRRKT